MGNGAKNKVIIFFVSLVLAGLCLGLCFLDAEPFYPAKIAGTVIFTVWGFSAVPAYVAAVAWMRARADELYSRFGFFCVFFVGTRRNTPAASGTVFYGVLLHT